MPRIDFYRDRVCLNVEANSLENAREVVKAAGSHVLIGILSANYPDVASAARDMQLYQKETEDRLSVGLGAGNPRQCFIVAELAAKLHPAHINQVFSCVGRTRALLGEEEGWVNALVAPSGTVGLVNVATGPLSSQCGKALIPVETAIAMVREMGGNSLKFFPMGGLQHEEEFRYVARACAEAHFALEPTGGITLENFRSVLGIALEEQVPQIIPHVYSSIIDKATGATKVQDVRDLFAIVQELVDR